MGRILNILLLLFMTGWVQSDGLYAQQDSAQNWQQVESIKIQGNYARFQVDQLGNYYLLSPSFSQIKKLDKNGDSTGRYDNVRQFGPIATIDVHNPLKIAVYYRDFSTVVLLDRFLNEINVIDLRKAGIMQASAIATSYDNAIWAYDLQAAKIMKVDGQGRILFASTDLRNVFDTPIKPKYIIDNNGLLYLYDPDLGWYLFDYYGGFKRQITIAGLKDVAVVDGTMVGRKDGWLWQFNPKKAIEPTQEALALPAGNEAIVQMQTRNQHLYILNSNGVQCYRRQP